MALAGRDADDVAADLNISGKTLMRAMTGQREFRHREIGRLAEILDVPEWFLRDGLRGGPSLDVADALARLSEDVAVIKTRLGVREH
jgi:hypothetical protein